ncbi:FadR/GntR family transcriptional regulator [Neobacillus sp. NPDC097160]|uniref:FadR/GntR family transcriptional regulator n=1 Tax=Neobacillus sp. NPDC097160 TaxID=3364298 RepID=UPI0038248651
MSEALYLDIVADIEKKIIEGTLKEGDKLPSEREMSKEQNVSRHVVREAFRVLEEKGFLYIHQGKGVYVIKPQGDIVTESLKRILQNDQTSAEDILEVREFLEVSIIKRAVNRATKEDIDRLKELYKRMEDKKNIISEFLLEDFNFHLTLANATQNKVFVVLAKTFFELTGNSLFDVTKYTQTVKVALEHHWNLINAIETRDQNAAVTVMKDHMNEIRNELEMLRNMNLF